VRAGKVDVIVVYKVDRLTRSLADFAKLVELFDQHNVSFVSVTQQFNTNHVHGAADVERAALICSVRAGGHLRAIRDKIAASKRKGLWVGGIAPLGYDTKDRKITVNEAEAERVRTIFRSYLKLGSLKLVMADLRKRRIVAKVRTLKSETTVGGIPFTRGPLRSPPSQPLLYWRSGLQGRDPQGRTDRHCGSGAIRRRSGKAGCPDQGP